KPCSSGVKIIRRPIITPHSNAPDLAVLKLVEDQAQNVQRAADFETQPVLFVGSKGIEFRVQSDRYRVAVLRELHDGYVLLHVGMEILIELRDGRRSGQGESTDLVDNVWSVVRDLVSITMTIEGIDIPLQVGLRLDPCRRTASNRTHCRVFHDPVAPRAPSRP